MMCHKIFYQILDLKHHYSSVCRTVTDFITIGAIRFILETYDLFSRPLSLASSHNLSPRWWGELESGETTIALTPAHQHKMDDLNGEVRMPQSSHERNPIEVCFDHSDVDFAYKNAVENSAVLVSEPEEKEWGQKLMYVQDIDGIVVRMGSLIF
ncbi:uncharacterized protein LOC111408369 [Olea europaea var. sylvestris]|uniref:uncharacterized protein LOC111408369 n=1 Tax=Olea europaea var. sylvestris TaxID=158386 RepID=UPI000C1D3ECA|nr:uncharacterized protein LOC111408369 [Olea europaea var. sylvestris]